MLYIANCLNARQSCNQYYHICKIPLHGHFAFFSLSLNLKGTNYLSRLTVPKYLTWNWETDALSFSSLHVSNVINLWNINMLVVFTLNVSTYGSPIQKCLKRFFALNCRRFYPICSYMITWMTFLYKAFSSLTWLHLTHIYHQNKIQMGTSVRCSSIAPNS